jgi:hypothetical protein
MGILSFLDGGGDQSAQRLNAQMLQEAKNIPLPVLKEYYPELYQLVAQLNPEQETAVNLGPSEMQGIATDPALRQAQMNALMKLQEVGDANGRDSRFMADANKLQNDINTNLQGQTGAIQQNLATRGMSGGGTELVARNMAVQNASNQQANSALELKAQADQRALEAIMNGGVLGGQIQNQDFNQKSAKAQAADSIAKFNAANMQQVQSNNVNAKNNAQQFNATNANNIAAQNTGVRNDAQLKNNSLEQQKYENELKKRGLINGATSSVADSYSREAAGNRQIIGGIVGAGAQYYGGGKK